jgi:ABC-type transport system involved in cytochrome c biogenesis ATPase subunit
MLQINDLEIIKNKRRILEASEISLASSSINAVTGEEKSGKSILTRTIHGLYSDYRGIIDFHNFDKHKSNSYLITKEVILLFHNTISENLAFYAKQHLDSIGEYSLLAGLENDLERNISDLSYSKQKLVELAIGCGVNPQLLIIDDFDKCFTSLNLILAGKLLSKFKADGGIVLLTSILKIPEMDSVFEIINGRVVQI